MADAGWRVSGIGHGAWSQEQQREWGLDQWIDADINMDRLLESRYEPELLIHCAGSGSVSFSTAQPGADYVRNVETTAAVLEFMRARAPHAALVLPSSAAVYGRAETLPISESAQTEPVSVYGMHKVIAEKLCAMHARLFGTSVVIVRLFSVYGNGLHKQLLWDACCKIRAGDTTFAGTGKELRDWLHVSDAVELLALAASHASPSCPVVNGGTGIGTSVEDIVNRVFEASGSELAPAFSGLARPGDPPGQVADINRVKQWGWKPRVACAEGVAEYVRWFYAHV